MRQPRCVVVVAGGFVLFTGLVLRADEEDMSALVNATASTRAEKARQGRLSYQLDQVANAHEHARALYDRGRRPRWVDSAGRVTAVIELRAGARPEDLSRAVAEAGGTIEGVVLDRVKVIVPPGGLRAVAAEPAVRIMRQPFYAESKVVSQGVKVIKADQYMSKTGDDGTGVTVGVFDYESFAQAIQLVGTELPVDTVATPYVRNGTFDSTHGTACAEIVHDVAPGAKLVLDGFGGTDEVAWAQGLLNLAGTVDIISHSLGFDNYAVPNGNSYFAKVADSVSSRGTLFVTAAGNEGQRYNHSKWSDKDKDNLLEFSGKTENLRVAADPGGYVSLRWDDPFGKSNHDYDLRVFDQSGKEVGRSESLQSGSQDPYEEVFFEDGISGIGTIQVRHDPSSPTKSNQRLFLHVGGPAGIDPAYITKAGSLTLPADSRTAVSVGAVKYSNKKLEASSSRGPTADNRVKPDLTAPDGVAAESWDGPFFGTSAATPHAAGAAALILSHKPGMSVSALKAALLKATAKGGGSKNNDEGFGLIDMSKAN